MKALQLFTNALAGQPPLFRGPAFADLEQPISVVKNLNRLRAGLQRRRQGVWIFRFNQQIGLAGSARAALGCVEDLDYCARLDSVNVVPLQTEPGVLKAVQY